MTLLGKQHGELIKLFYLTLENAAEEVRVYSRNHKLKWASCSLKSVHKMVKKFQETG